jgi:Protein of unknown function (DUF1622)
MKRLSHRDRYWGFGRLLATHVIKTVTKAPTFTNIGVLAGAIVTRAVLSWSLVLEMEGRWSWQPARVTRSEVTA